MLHQLAAGRARGRTMLAAAALTIGTIGLSGPAAVAQTELRLHTFVPPVHIIYSNIISPWADEVKEATNGEVIVTLYPAMQLGGSPPELIRQARDGVVDLVFTLPGYTSPAFPRTQMIELPGLQRDGIAATHMMWDLLDPYLLPDFENLHVIALWAAEDAGIMTTEKPVRTVADIKGLRLRTPSAAQAKQVERLGAAPVAMPITQVYPQMDQGVIDGAQVPFTTILDFRLGEVANNFTITGPVLGRSSFLIAMNKAKYDSLSDAARAAIDELSGRGLSLKATQVYLDRAAEAVESVRNTDGKEVIEWDRATQREAADILKPLVAEWIEESTAAGIPAKDMLELAGYQLP